jgi:ribosome biogenesis GTPase
LSDLRPASSSASASVSSLVSAPGSAPPIDLAAYGWDPGRAPLLPPGCEPARVVAQHRDRWRVVAALGSSGLAELTAELAGRLRHRAGAGPDAVDHLPVVGDFVAVAARPGEGKGTITALLPRRSCLVRRDAGPVPRAQAVAANVDLVVLVAAADGYRALQARRLERAAALAWESGAQPLLVLSKCDLVDDADELALEAAASVPGVDVLTSGEGDDAGVEALRARLAPARTAVLLGPSGVGKSTLTNRLLGEARLATGATRDVDGKGRHTTTARELVLLPGGGAVIDTPGVRELGLWAGEQGGVEAAFADVEALAPGCRFRDCGHEGEPGCAVQAAVERGDLDPERLEAWAHLQRELRFVSRKRDKEARRVERAQHRRATRAFERRVREREGD